VGFPRAPHEKDGAESTKSYEENADARRNRLSANFHLWPRLVWLV